MKIKTCTDNKDSLNGSTGSAHLKSANSKNQLVRAGKMPDTSDDASFSDNFSDLSYVRSKRCCPVWIYDSKDKTLFGRTCSSWGLILLFYLIFFSCLAAFFMGMMLTFMNFIVPIDKPLRSGDHSLLKFTPGLGMRPSSNAALTILKYSSKDRQTWEAYKMNIDAFLSQYYYVNTVQKSDPANLADCKDGVKTPDEIDRICKFDVSQLGSCTAENNYGFNTKKPCVVLKINKVYGWVPNIIDKSQPHPLVKCKGQNALDDVNIGDLEYSPGVVVNGTKFGKFDHAFFPYVGQVSYLGPLVSLKFNSLPENTIVLVECELFNIDTNSDRDKLKFEVLVD